MDHLFRPLSCLLQTGCWTILWASEAPYLSQLISLLVRGLPRVQGPFLFHRGTGSILLPIFFFSLVLPGYMESFLHVQVSEIFCQHSVGFLWEFFHMYRYFWCIYGTKWAPHPSILPCWLEPYTLKITNEFEFLLLYLLWKLFSGFFPPFF